MTRLFRATVYFCKNCGVQISSGAYCASCLSGGNGQNGDR